MDTLPSSESRKQLECMLNQSFVRKISLGILPLLLAALSLQPVSAADWSYPRNKTIWNEALGPDNLDALATIEGRPFSFETTSPIRSKRYDNVLPLLNEALSKTAPHVTNSPEDVAHCYVNIGCFYFIRGDLQLAEQNIRSALRIAQANAKTDSLLVAEILEYLTMVQRAQGGFSRPSETSPKHYQAAENSYKVTRHLKADGLGQSHPDIKHVNSHLAMSYFDAMQPSKAYDLMHKTGAPDLCPFMPSRYGEDVLEKMASFAREMIDKYKPVFHDETNTFAKLKEMGIASIIGNWTVPTDITTTAKIQTKATSRETVEGSQTMSGSGEQTSRVADVPIMLCRGSDYASLESIITSYGRVRGLAAEDFGVTWPATHKQAEDLLVSLRQAGEGFALETQKTDKNGDYEFTRIPKGKYFLFAALVTRDACGYWMRPPEFINVTQVAQFTVDFPEEQETIIWSKERGRHGASQGLFSQPAQQKKYLVPSPPPTVPFGSR